MNRYPATPRGWSVAGEHRIGRFVTSATFRHPDGRTVTWSSRRHRKHASGLSRVDGSGERALWAPHRASWWIALLFVLGSSCFVLAPLPAYLQRVGPSADAATFFVGSVFFTAAAALQWLETINADRTPGTPSTGSSRMMAWEPGRIDWWSSGVQLLGTLFFNASTFRALTATVDSASYDQVVWRPDALGSICFLVSGWLAYAEVTGGALARPPGNLEGALVSVNLFGCLAFGVSAVASYVLPATGQLLNETVTNLSTSVGALAFLVGAVLLLPEGARETGVSPLSS